MPVSVLPLEVIQRIAEALDDRRLESVRQMIIRMKSFGDSINDLRTDELTRIDLDFLSMMLVCKQWYLAASPVSHWSDFLHHCDLSREASVSPIRKPTHEVRNLELVSATRWIPPSFVEPRKYRNVRDLQVWSHALDEKWITIGHMQALTSISLHGCCCTHALASESAVFTHVRQVSLFFARDCNILWTSKNLPALQELTIVFVGHWMNSKAFIYGLELFCKEVASQVHQFAFCSANPSNFGPEELPLLHNVLPCFSSLRQLALDLEIDYVLYSNKDRVKSLHSSLLDSIPCSAPVQEITYRGLGIGEREDKTILKMIDMFVHSGQCQTLKRLRVLESVESSGPFEGNEREALKQSCDEFGVELECE